MKELIRKFIPKSILLFYHRFLAWLAPIIFNHPSQKMIVIGVTGTTGKSTTCNLIAKILEEAGFKVGLISTYNFKIANHEWLNETKQTMPGRLRLQKLLSQMVKAGCSYAIVETSSEGIAQYRHQGINYDVACFTNLTPEHIEFHGSFEKYKEAKGRLFAKLSQDRHKYLNIKGNKISVKKNIIVNLDDPHAKYFLSFWADKKWGYTIKIQDSNPTDPVGKFKNQKYSDNGVGNSKLKILSAEDLEVLPDGVKFIVENTPINLKLFGKFNVYNALSAITVTFALGINLEIAKKALEKIIFIPGRAEMINEGQNFLVIVDYAHEPAGLKNIFETCLTLNPKRIISVLGAAGGGRDKSKRPTLGKLAGQMTDLVIVTNEDPYQEDPQKIINEVALGAEQAGKCLGKNLLKILDRKKAILIAIKKARPGDLVIITGKGAETKMATSQGLIPWDERQIVREALRTLR